MNAARPKLRTKTGCLTCRQRRKKCDEKLPVCDLCTSSRRECLWPSSDELLDRRYASHYESRHQGPSAAAITEYLDNDNNSSENLAITNIDNSIQSQDLSSAVSSSLPNILMVDSVCPLDLLSQANTAHSFLSNHLELQISRHFSDEYFSLLLLPDCYRGFHDGWLTEIQQLMLTHKSLYYSVLACAASHIFLRDSAWEMQHLALSYYTKGLKELSLLLQNTSHYENHNALLMSVMLLYLHGSIGWGTDNDIPRHVNAATHIITLRLLNRSVGIQKLFDRVAIESVIYQQFLVTTGLWSDTVRCGHPYNSEFWDGAEKLLDQSTLLAGASRKLESPVLDVPLSLFRITLILRQYYRLDTDVDFNTLDQIRRDVKAWEGQILHDQDLSSVHNATDSDSLMFNEISSIDETYLYVTVASLLLEQIGNREKSNGLPSAVDSNKWQVKMSLQLLKKHANDPKWSRSYLRNWPVYTLGLFVPGAEDRKIITDDLERCWDSTKMSQVVRYYQDLQCIWGVT